MEVRLASKETLKHIGLWVLWYTLNTLQVVTVMTEFTTMSWIQLAYNYISLVFVFYTVSSLMLAFFKLSVIEKRYKLKIFHISDKRMFSAMLVICFYLSLSVFFDCEFFGNVYDNLLINFFQRFNRVLPYVFAAVNYADSQFQKHQRATEKIFYEYRIHTLDEHNKNMEKIIRLELNSDRGCLWN